MNRRRISISITLTLLLTGISIPMTNAATKPKAAGRTSSSIANTILNGKGAPLNTLGIDGDFYIDTRSLLIYGPKKNKKWPAPQSLQGPVGVSGVDGKNGSEGKPVSLPAGVAGPSGAQGAKGETGTAGSNGAAGLNGATGSQSATGGQGPTGPTGSSGGGTPGATGATGAPGAVGAKGETGTVGSLGATGLKGETGTAGTVGATGPSNVYINALPTWTLSTATHRTSSTSAYLPKFLAGKSYIYTIYLTGVSDATTGIFAIDIIHEDSSSSTFNYVVISKANFELETKLRVYDFLITGVISVGISDVGIAIKVIDDMGVTSVKPLSLSGRMFATMVGSIGTL